LLKQQGTIGMYFFYLLSLLFVSLFHRLETKVPFSTSKSTHEQRYIAGIVLNSMHFYPNDTSNAADVAAAQRGYGKF